MVAADEGSAQPQPTGLRRRLGVLERAHSLSSHSSSDDSRNKQTAGNNTGEDHHAEETSGQSHSSVTDYETYSETSESEDGRDGARTPVQHETTASSSSRRPDPPPYDPESSFKRSWYEFDLAVVAALVSPVGNWLTGGDHVRNVLVVMLIIFYLHQVIEVPWSLYQKSRPRQRSSSHIPSPSNTKERRYHLKATSELRFLELFFLLFATLSPFLGAYALRYLSVTLTNSDILSSWFNTSLFIFATGIRPWTHLVQRLSQRVTDLHDIIHYPTPESSSETAEAMRSELEEMKNKIQGLQKALSELSAKMVRDTDEVYDYVDDAVEMVEKAAKKHERKCEKNEGKVKELEISVGSLKKMRTRPRPSSLSFHEQPSNGLSSIPPKVTNGLAYISSVLPPWLSLPSAIVPSSESTLPPQYEPKHSPSATVTRYSILSLSSPEGLTTIPEESYQLQHHPASPSSMTMAASFPSSSTSSVSRLRGGHTSSHGNNGASGNGSGINSAYVSEGILKYASGNGSGRASPTKGRSRSPSPSGNGVRGDRSSRQLPPEYAKLGLFQRLLVRLLYIAMFPLRIVWGNKTPWGYA